MSEPLRISAKTLGEVTLPYFCPRCFWLKLHAKHLPFQIFPGIFRPIEIFEGRVSQSSTRTQHIDLAEYQGRTPLRSANEAKRLG